VNITAPANGASFVAGSIVTFTGTACSEPKLIEIAYAFEQAAKHRRAPTYPKTVNTWNPQ